MVGSTSLMMRFVRKRRRPLAASTMTPKAIEMWTKISCSKCGGQFQLYSVKADSTWVCKVCKG